MVKPPLKWKIGNGIRAQEGRNFYSMFSKQRDWTGIWIAGLYEEEIVRTREITLIDAVNRAISSSISLKVSGDLETTEIMQQLRDLKRQYEQLIKRLNDLEKRLGEPQQVVEVELRDVSYSQAKKEIKKYFKDGKTHDVGEIADELRLDIRLVVEVCNDLIKAGVIGE